MALCVNEYELFELFTSDPMIFYKKLSQIMSVNPVHVKFIVEKKKKKGNMASNIVQVFLM